MIRILLVDDDPLFHSTFMGLADWEAHGCTVAYRAENGQQAVAILAEHPVDVLFTDMVMPVMGGVELTRYVRRTYPEIVCYALSSFDDFDYVRQSLKEGARDYLLKHALTRGAIEEILAALPEAKRGEGAPSGVRAVFDELFFSLIRRRDGEPESLDRLAADAGVDFPRPPLLAVAVRIRDLPALFKRYEAMDRYLQMLSTAVNIAQGTLERYGNTLSMSDNFSTICAVVSNEGFASRLFGAQTAHMLSKSLTSILKRYCNIDVSVAADAACSLGEVVPAFRRLEDALDAQGDGDFLSEREEGAEIVSIRLGTERALAEIIRGADFSDVETLIREECEACRSQASSKQALRHIAVEFLNVLNRICQREGLKLEALFGTDVSPYTAVARMSSYRETVEFVTDAYRALFDCLNGGADSGNRIVRSAVRAIRSQFTKDISLTSVAESIHCNSAYLSRVFKAETGKGFVRYLTDYRLEKALELMREGRLPIRAIAKNVGFLNYNYFFKVFKQRMGTTPQSYIARRFGGGQSESEAPD